MQLRRHSSRTRYGTRVVFGLQQELASLAATKNLSQLARAALYHVRGLAIHWQQLSQATSISNVHDNARASIAAQPSFAYTNSYQL